MTADMARSWTSGAGATTTSVSTLVRVRTRRSPPPRCRTDARIARTAPETGDRPRCRPIAPPVRLPSAARDRTAPVRLPLIRPLGVLRHRRPDARQLGDRLAEAGRADVPARSPLAPVRCPWMRRRSQAAPPAPVAFDEPVCGLRPPGPGLVRLERAVGPLLRPGLALRLAFRRCSRSQRAHVSSSGVTMPQAASTSSARVNSDASPSIASRISVS